MNTDGLASTSGQHTEVQLHLYTHQTLDSAWGRHHSKCFTLYNQRIALLCMMTNTKGWEYKYLYFSTHRHRVLHKAIAHYKIILIFFSTDVLFLKNMPGHVFYNTFHFFWLETIKIRYVKMTERDPDNLIILQYLLPCIQRPSIVCTHSKTVKLVQHLKSI